MRADARALRSLSDKTTQKYFVSENYEFVPFAYGVSKSPRSMSVYAWVGCIILLSKMWPCENLNQAIPSGTRRMNSDNEPNSNNKKRTNVLAHTYEVDGVCKWETIRHENVFIMCCAVDSSCTHTHTHRRMDDMCPDRRIYTISFVSILPIYLTK